MFANVFNVALVVNLTVRMIGRKIVPGGLRARTGGMKIRRGKNISGCCKQIDNSQRLVQIAESGLADSNSLFSYRSKALEKMLKRNERVVILNSARLHENDVTFLHLFSRHRYITIIFNDDTLSSKDSILMRTYVHCMCIMFRKIIRTFIVEYFCGYIQNKLCKNFWKVQNKFGNAHKSNKTITVNRNRKYYIWYRSSS